MKIAEKLVSILEDKVFTIEYLEVSNSLNAIADLVKFIGDDKLSKEIKVKSDTLYDISKKTKMDKNEFDKVMAKVDLPSLFKTLKKVFGDYEKTGKGIRYGRSKVSLEAALLNFVKVAQKAKKGETK